MPDRTPSAMIWPPPLGRSPKPATRQPHATVTTSHRAGCLRSKRQSRMVFGSPSALIARRRFPLYERWSCVTDGFTPEAQLVVVPALQSLDVGEGYFTLGSLPPPGSRRFAVSFSATASGGCARASSSSHVPRHAVRSVPPTAGRGTDAE